MATSGVEFDKNLIELVRANPSLYERDLRSAPYESHERKKSELWNSVATSLKVDVCTCTTRWRNLREKLRRELQKEQSTGISSEWTLMPSLAFVITHLSYHNKDRLQNHHITSALQDENVTWSILSSEQLIEEVHDDDDPLQEAMDEQQIILRPEQENETYISADEVSSSGSNVPQANNELLKRIGALLEGLGTTNRIKAQKRILAYLCKCNLRALNDEQIDDISV